jgi:hypothetical protein
MMPYYSYRSAMKNEMTIDYDIMRGTSTSMKYLLGGYQALTPWIGVHQDQQMGHHAWISNDDSLQVHPLERNGGDQAQCIDSS